MKERDIHRAEPRHDSIKSHHIEEHRHDPYKARHKLPEPTVCSQCGAVFSEGRWQWVDKAAEGAHKERARPATVAMTNSPLERSSSLALSRKLTSRKSSD